MALTVSWIKDESEIAPSHYIIVYNTHISNAQKSNLQTIQIKTGSTEDNIPNFSFQTTVCQTVTDPCVSSWSAHEIKDIPLTFIDRQQNKTPTNFLKLFQASS